MNDELLKSLKLSLRLDDGNTIDDEILNRTLATAQNYVIGAVGNPTGSMQGFYDRPDVKPQYDMVVISLASAYYTYRSALQANNLTTVDMVSNSIIGNLRNKYIEVEAENAERQL